jgi:hypothetical protein
MLAHHCAEMLLELVVIGETVRRKQGSGIGTELWDIMLQRRSLRSC